MVRLAKPIVLHDFSSPFELSISWKASAFSRLLLWYDLPHSTTTRIDFLHGRIDAAITWFDCRLDTNVNPNVDDGNWTDDSSFDASSTWFRTTHFHTFLYSNCRLRPSRVCLSDSLYLSNEPGKVGGLTIPYNSCSEESWPSRHKSRDGCHSCLVSSGNIVNRFPV